MITRQDAEGIAERILGRPATDDARPWELREFDHGWLIQEALPAGIRSRGAAHRVIERETGHVVQFPSSVPPVRIVEEYPAVRDRGGGESV
jgi:hypothetical protein